MGVLVSHGSTHRNTPCLARRMTTGSTHPTDMETAVKARLAGMKRLPRGFFPGAPDLAIEVLSPSDTPGHTHEKLTH